MFIAFAVVVVAALAVYAAYHIPAAKLAAIEAEVKSAETAASADVTAFIAKIKAKL